jgi:hypothetical protein
MKAKRTKKARQLPESVAFTDGPLSKEVRARRIPILDEVDGIRPPPWCSEHNVRLCQCGACPAELLHFPHCKTARRGKVLALKDRPDFLADNSEMAALLAQVVAEIAPAGAKVSVEVVSEDELMQRIAEGGSLFRV